MPPRPAPHTAAAARDALFPPLLLLLAGIALLLALIGGCGRGDSASDASRDSAAADYQPHFSDRPADTPAKREVRFGIHPLHNPSRLFERYGPLVALLNQRIPDAHFVLEASRNYEEFDRKLYGGSFDLALPNPYQTVIALRHGYRVFGKMGDDAAFRGIVLVRKDSGIAAPAELKGRPVSFPAATALAATLLPQHYLHRHGLPFGTYPVRYVGSQESAIMNVVLGNTAAGATWPAPWIAFQAEHPERAAQLRVLLETPALVNNALLAREDFPPELLKKTADVLFALHTDSEGRRILAALPLSHFEAADAASYRPVRDFLAAFARDVRPLDQ